MTKSMRTGAVVCLSVSLLAMLVSSPSNAQPTQDVSRDGSLISFLPAVDEVFLEKTTSNFGNVRVLVTLNEKRLDELRKVTGRTDFVVLGPEGHQTILRDDGKGGDERAGDATFTGIGTADLAELTSRAEADVANTERAASAEVPVFSGRTLSGTRSATPFDIAAFNSGARVKLDEPVEFLSDGAANESPVGTTKLSAEIVPTPDAMVTLGINAFQAQSLMITDVSVVTDPARTIDPCTGVGNPNGVWTFKHLMTEMANQSASGIDPADFTQQWLENWLSNRTINSDLILSRNQMSVIINEWLVNSGGTKLDLDISPLRLLAIVSRLDLATTTGGGSGYGASTGTFLDGGEARFVFGFVIPPGWSSAGFIAPVPLGGGCLAQRFSVIFEYRVPKCDCKEVRSWARQWEKLSTLPFPSATYNAALERITQQFARANANPLKPNGSALGQLRTNEVSLAAPWQLLEFQLTQFPFTFLTETTVGDNPRDSFNFTNDFTSWVLGPVLAGSPKVPLFFSGATGGNFLGAEAQVPEINPAIITFHWDGAPGTINFANPAENDARFRASLNTCGACHRRETMTDFVHVNPQTPGLPAQLSPFLTGIIGVPDPANPAGTPLRDFDDLARREIDLKKKARMACFRFHPVAVSAVQHHLAKFRVLPDDLFGGIEVLPGESRISVAVDALANPGITQVH